MSIKKYANSAWQDIDTLQKYANGAWQSCDYARKYSNGAWQDVWTDAIWAVKDGEIIAPIINAGTNQFTRCTMETTDKRLKIINTTRTGFYLQIRFGILPEEIIDKTLYFKGAVYSANVFVSSDTTKQLYSNNVGSYPEEIEVSCPCSSFCKQAHLSMEGFYIELLLKVTHINYIDYIYIK